MRRDAIRITRANIFLVNDRRILNQYSMGIVAGDRGRPVLSFQAGDGFGLGLSSTKWIFVGVDGG